MSRKDGLRIVGEKTLRDFEIEYEEGVRKIILEGLSHHGTIRKRKKHTRPGLVWCGRVWSGRVGSGAVRSGLIRRWRTGDSVQEGGPNGSHKGQNGA